MGNPNKVKIPSRTEISKHHKVVESKSCIGDTIVGVRGGNKDCLLTLLDMKSKFCFIKQTFDRPRKSLGYLTPNEVMNKHLNRIYRSTSKTAAFQT